MFRVSLYFQIAFCFVMAVFDAYWALHASGWMAAYFTLFAVFMLALGVWNIDTLRKDIKSEREHKEWMEKFETLVRR